MPTWLRTALHIILAGLLLLVSLYIFDKLSEYLVRGLSFALPLVIPFLLALFISFLLEPMVGVLQRKARLSRGPAVALSMLLIFSFFGTIITLLLLRLITELIHLSRSIPFIISDIQSWVGVSLPRLQRFYGDLPPSVTSAIQSSFGSIADALQNYLKVTLDYLIGTFSAVPGIITVVIVSLLATYFITKDRRLLGLKWVRIMPSPYGEKSIFVLKEVTSAFISYIKAQGILVSISTLISIVGLYIIGAEYALTMGLLIGFFDIIPVLGPGTVILPWVIWSLVSGNIVFGLKLLSLYGVILVARQLLETKVVADNLGLHPLATLLALFLGFKLLGFIGMVVGPILLIAVQAVVKAGFPTPRVK
ncbi:sporulation integral membrane protein YtvI [Desulforamulus aeronauticus]|uniref:Sporulation integral membrane protein YtvI n=1 Tax=Desulforamulus aeronauticus DSM 10349 TaxID=1121421 RepID=A0A1M6U816_9FIRM|nr:sporulation integral membrane protein YtvI [Desulforamulus aeronauticus]SHK65337.1 sporulation integral membrane protein YtvI [Desulforamulus aeronauticus DSM 10349]